ncbi:pyridoxamine 5'-phosphate oxidase family protein [Azohydromonas caseinilytica]|uniref:Pyridoxamine 5'-phosphate oxidase family protein n=1 Tax=Azohydromonas caseinilytica TaxID=2728836 RepID=A0A848FJ02_9BURK|nr:pyridoxamine 5'-phosphate oxidase family protein [Azohydromonas caseinilytica]NML18875.1 pyridoxamine 5'-phosphate oxidase family protein [Azohydromonas caseinilytica]
MSISLLSDATVAFIEREVAIDLASCGADGRSSTARGFACRVAPDRRRLTIWVRRADAGPLLQHLVTQDQVAAVFCLPETEASIQIKGSHIAIAPAGPEELALVQAYCARFVDGVMRLGYERGFSEAYMAVDPERMVAVSFTPECVFDQTPGPQAGRQQEGGAA